MSAAVHDPAAIRRLTACLHQARRMVADGASSAPLARLAAAAGCAADELRADLAALGVRGRPRIGCRLAEVVAAVERLFGWDQACDAVLVGAGSLGSALLGHPGFAARGVGIVAAFDTDPARIGGEVAGHPVLPLARLPGIVRRLDIRLGILAVPGFSAPSTARLLYDAGVRGFWNLSGGPLNLPDDALVEDLDLGAALAALARRLP
jgi:redox-sensing transcriptional repressor